MARVERNRIYDLYPGLQQGMAYYGCRLIEKMSQNKEDMPDLVISCAMRFYHLALNDKKTEVAAASLALSYGTHMDQGRQKTDMSNQNPLRPLQYNVLRQVLDLCKQIDKSAPISTPEAVERLRLIVEMIIPKVDAKNRYINDSRLVLDTVIRRPLFSFPLPNGEQDMANLKSLARAYLKDWYYVPSCVGYDLYQNAVCAMYTAKITLGIDTPMNKQLGFRLRNEGPLSGWANTLFQFYEAYPTIQNLEINKWRRRSGWVSVERNQPGGLVKEGLLVWDYKKFL